MFRVGLSVVTLYSVPARTLVSPSAVNSLPLRLRTTGGPEGARVPLIRPPPGAIAKTTGVGAGLGAPAPGAAPAALGAAAPGPAPPAPGAAARAGPAPGPPAPGAPAPGGPPGGPPPPPKPPNPTAPPPPPTFMRPTSPLHTAAFQVGLTSQASSTSMPVMLTMKELAAPVMVPSLSLNTEVL